MDKVFRFFNDGVMSLPMTMYDLDYEGFPPQFSNDHGDQHDDCQTMEYLGVKDKDGQQLCEQDFVTLFGTSRQQRYIVVRVENCCTYAFASVLNHAMMEVIGEVPFKIIGNACENPELLPKVVQS